MARRSVAVVRALPGLGDLLCAVPALRSLRARFPGARVTLVGLPSAAWMVERFPRYLDELLSVDAFPGLAELDGDPAAALGFLARAQERRFDLVVQLHGSGVVSNLLSVLLGGRATAGTYLPGHWCPDSRLFVPYPTEASEVARLRAPVLHLGAPDTGSDLEFPVTAADEAEAERFALEAPYACVHPGASLPERRWPAEAFARVAERLAAHGLRVVTTGAPQESDVAAGVARAARAPVRVLAGRTSLGALAAVLRGARLLVSNDTGVSHLAAALGVPSVVVFSTSDVQRWAPLDEDRHRRVDVRRAHGDGVDAVAAACAALLGS